MPDYSSWANTVRRGVCSGRPSLSITDGIKHFLLVDIIVSWPQGCEMVKSELKGYRVWYRNGYLYGNDTTFITRMIMDAKAKLKIRPSVETRSIVVEVHNHRSTVDEVVTV